MDRTTITEEDEGKKVIDSRGEEIGIVSGVRDGTAYVDPNPGIGDSMMAKLGWQGVDQDDYPLEGTNVEEVTDDEIRLRSDM